MGQSQIATPESPVPAGYAIFDSTTGALAAGSWGVAVAVNVADQGWSINPTFGVSAAGTPGDLFAVISVPSVSGANNRRVIEIAPTGGLVNLATIDLAGALANLPANTRVQVMIYRRNASIG